MNESYLGDGVYASYDAQTQMIWLDLRAQDGSRIALDPEVFSNLLKFAQMSGMMIPTRALEAMAHQEGFSLHRIVLQDAVPTTLLAQVNRLLEDLGTDERRKIEKLDIEGAEYEVIEQLIDDYEINRALMLSSLSGAIIEMWEYALSCNDHYQAILAMIEASLFVPPGENLSISTKEIETLKVAFAALNTATPTEEQETNIRKLFEDVQFPWIGNDENV